MPAPRHLISIPAVVCVALSLGGPGCGSSGRGSGFGGGTAPPANNSASGTGNGSGSGSVPSSGSGGNGSSGGTFGGSSTGSGSGGSPDGGTCTGGNLCNQIHSCPNGSTTISGTIYDPAGKNPLYDVVAYVPNGTPAALTPGASCYSCSDLYTGNPIATALTGPDGKFQIQDAPDGANIPLVIQIGKWRRQFTVPNVTRCQDTAIPDRMLTLPKNTGEGDIPAIAIATGGADSMECLLQRIGVAQSEYGGGAGGIGRIHIFQGDNGASTNPPAPVASQSLWDSQADLMKFDIVILSCEGHETTAMNQQALFDYAAAGGRAFASHFHYAWFNSGPFGAANLAQWYPSPAPPASTQRPAPYHHERPGALPPPVPSLSNAGGAFADRATPSDPSTS